MAIETERAGLFRGKIDGRAAWYVADPSRAVELEAAWRKNWGGTTRTTIQWVAKWLAFFAVFILVVLGTILVTVTFALGPVVLGAIFAAVGGLGLGGWISTKVYPRRQGGLHRIPGVLPILPEVRQWADDTIPASDLWDLSVRVDRVRQVAAAAWYWTVADDEAPVQYPEDIIQDVVHPALVAQWALEIERLDEVAARVGFPVSAEMRETPAPFAGAAQS